MMKRICDYCGEPWPKNQTKLTRTPNDEAIYTELCDVCLEDIFTLASKMYRKAINKKSSETPEERKKRNAK